MLVLLLAPVTHAYADDESDFQRWLVEFKTRAVSEGIAQNVIDAAFEGISLDQDVIDLDQKQPENKITLEKYLSNTINDRRIRIGRKMLAEHHDVLKRIGAKYHVQPRFIVALWGIESDYGAHQGNFSVVQSLATLAFEGRRREFFSNELVAALRVMQDENMSTDQLLGSWAGAMGNCQFMPSTYLKYAQSGDGDKHRNIWTSNADVFASIANYLHGLGWQDDRGWGGWVQFPDDMTADITVAKPLVEWEKLGVMVENKGPLKGSADALYAINPGKPEEGALLITDNYKAILQWNRSRYFATAVGTLADKIGEK